MEGKITVKTYGIAAHGYVMQYGVPISKFHLGNGLNFGKGIFLTASHIFSFILPNGDLWTTDAQYFGVNQERAENTGIPTAAPVNLYAYDPSAVLGTDLAMVNAGVSIDSGPLTPVVVFADQTAATNFLTKYPSMTLSTVTTSNGQTGSFKGIIGNPVPNAGQTIATTISAGDGDSGGTATVAVGNNLTNYAVGILSTSDTHDQNARFTTLDNAAYTQACAALGNGLDPSTMPTDLIIGATANEHVRGSVRKANIITNGDNDLILAGSGGGLIDTETGQNNVVFLPAAYGQSDPGTTVVCGPGIKTIVGGGPNDKLVVPLDRLWTVDQGTPDSARASSTSDTVQLLGGWGNVPGSIKGAPGTEYYYFDTASNAANYASPIPTDWEIGGYDLQVEYLLYNDSDGDADLDVMLGGSAPTSTPVLSAPMSATDPIEWDSELMIKNYHPGDFGLSFSSDNSYLDAMNGIIPLEQFRSPRESVMKKLMAAPQPEACVDDDPSIVWNGRVDAAPASATPSDDELAADLASVQAAGTDHDPSVPLPNPNPNAPITVAAGATATITASNATVSASGAGSTINFKGTGESASISSGTVNLGNAASATITGDADTVALVGNGAATMTGAKDIVTVAGTGNGVSANAATISLVDQARLTLQGSGNTITLGSATGLDASASTGATVNVSGTGAQALVTAGMVNVGAGASVTVSGDRNTYTLASNAQLTANGSNSRVTLTGSGDTVSLTGSGASFDISGTGHGLSASSAVVALEAGARATVQGNADTFSLASNTGLDASSGIGEAVHVGGTGVQLAVGAASVGLDANTSASVWGNGDTFTFHGASSLSAAGTNEAFVFTPTPGSVVIGGYDPSDSFTIDPAIFATWHDLITHASQSGPDTLIRANPTDTLTLKNVTLSSLVQSHFHFA